MLLLTAHIVLQQIYKEEYYSQPLYQQFAMFNPSVAAASVAATSTPVAMNQLQPPLPELPSLTVSSVKVDSQSQ